MDFYVLTLYLVHVMSLTRYVTAELSAPKCRYTCGAVRWVLWFQEIKYPGTGSHHKP